MRILLFGPYPFPGQPVSGGVMAVVHALALGLARRPGIEVAVAAAHVHAEPGVDQDGAVQVYRIPVPRRPRTRWHRPLRRALVETAAAFRPDIIHGHGTGYNAAAALDAPWPSVITVHGVVRYEAALSGPNSLKERMAWKYDALFEAGVLRRARRCIAISPYVRHAFDGYTNIHWYDIENPVDDACFEITPQPENGRFLSVARVIPRKGIDALIEAFARVAGDYPQAQLRIAGETDSYPDYVDACRRVAASAGLAGRVSILGSLQRRDLFAEYAQAQAMILAARQETAPVAVAEALAAGCPVVATQAGGVPFMVEHQKTGLLVAAGDTRALASALTEVLSNLAQTRRWSLAARTAADRFRLNTIVDKTLAVYEEILAANDA